MESPFPVAPIQKSYSIMTEKDKQCSGFSGRRFCGEYLLRLAPEVEHVETFKTAEAITVFLNDERDKVLAAGRNRVVRAVLPGFSGPVVVKAFGRESFLKCLIDRWRGSKACRTWQAANTLARAGIGTPAPLACIEQFGKFGLCRSAWLVTLYEPDTVSFADELARLLREDPQCWKIMNLCQKVADLVSAMHTAGFVHCDLGNQNILMRRDGDGAWKDAMVLDLNRGRLPGAVSARWRARDVSRIYLPSDFLRVFFEMLSGETPPSRAFLRWERFYRKRYALHCATRPLRHPLRVLRNRGKPGLYPAARDLWVWDERSGQPVCPLTSKDRRRYYSLSRSLDPLIHSLAALPKFVVNYRKTRPTAFGKAVACDGLIGLAIEPLPERWQQENDWLCTLKVKLPLIVRLYHHETPEQRRFRCDKVRQLSAEGYPVSVILVQDRAAVKNVNKWTDFMTEMLHAVAASVETVQLGHCINRVKWGFWSAGEYRRWLQASGRVLAQFPDLRVIGPGAIDFEYPFTIAALAHRKPEMRFHGLSHLLYVDRRGAPENRQGTFDLVDKCAMLKALAHLTPRCEERVFITEMNWPLSGTGVYSPVGAPYVSPGERFNDPSVDEDAAAAYMLRYLLLACGSGMVNRVYWWRLAAHGYGLIDDLPDGDSTHEWRSRPGFDVLLTWLRITKGATLELDRDVCNCASSLRRFKIRNREGRDVVLAYSTAHTVPLPSEWIGRDVMDARGLVLRSADASTSIGAMPLYVFE